MRAIPSAVLALVALDGCVFAPCTLIGCASPVSIDIGPIQDPARYAGATVTLCINERCGAAVMSDVPPDESSGVGGVTTGDLVLSAFLWNDATYHLSIGLGVYAEDDFHDGDAYTLEIIDVDGNPILEHAWSASYTESFPNGERCGGRCVNHTLDLPAP
jgi:hypothetical protein